MSARDGAGAEAGGEVLLPAIILAQRDPVLGMSVDLMAVPVPQVASRVAGGGHPRAIKEHLSGAHAACRELL